MKGGQPPFFVGGNSHDGLVRLMGRDSRALHRHLGLIAVGALLVLATGVSLANSVGVTPTGIRHTATTASGVRATATLEAVYSGTNVNGTRYYNVPVPVSSSTVGNLAKSALRRAGPAAAWYGLAKGAIEGAGWAIDELSKQVTEPPTGESQPPGTTMYCYTATELRCTTSQSGAVAIGNSVYSNCSFNRDNGSYWIVSCSGGALTLVRNTFPTPTFDWGSGSQHARDITDQELGNLLKGLPSVVNAIMIDPDTGAPIRFPELAAAMNDLRKALEAANGLEPGPDTAIGDPDATQVHESEWPMFCGWATTVCDFIDWMREEPPAEEKPEVPWDEQPIEQVQWTSGLGGGSCPAPVVVPINFNGHNSVVEFEFTPMCSFASTMRPILIAIAMLLAGFILAGLRENKGA